MDKLEELKSKIEQFQAKSAAKDEIKAFIALVIAFLKKSKVDFESLSSENLSKIQESISEIENQKTEMLSGVNSLAEKATKDFDKKLVEAKKLLAEIRAIKVIPGEPGKDADEEKILENLLARIPPQEEYEVFTLEEKGEQIVGEINALPTDKDEYKIDASHIKNLPTPGQTIVGGPRLLSSLSDVAISSPTDGQSLVWDSALGMWVNETVSGGGGGISDGDKGDITVSSSGAVWTIDNDVVTFAKMQNINTATILGRTTALSGDVEEITTGPALTLSGGILDVDTITASYLGSNAVTTTKINNDAVTYAKIQNVSAASKLLGRGSASGGGDVEEITLGAGLTMTGTTLSASGGATTFTGLSDTFSYGGNALNLVRVNSGETALEPLILRDGRILVGDASNIPVDVDVTGDVTISNTGVTTINAGAVDIAMLSATGTPSGTTFLRGDNTWATPAGSGTVTNTGGNLTANSVVLGAGTTDVKVIAGITTDGTSQLNLGVNATTLGKLKLFGNTSGDVTLQPNAVAGTGVVLTLPATTGTLVTTASPTFTGTLTTPDAILGTAGVERVEYSSTSGYLRGYDPSNVQNWAIGSSGDSTFATLNIYNGVSNVAEINSTGLFSTLAGARFANNTGPVFYSDVYTTPLGSLNFSSDGVFSLDSGTGGHNARFDFSGVTGTKTLTAPDASGTILIDGGALGTPASGTLTNCTGLPTAGLVDNAVTYAKLQQLSAYTVVVNDTNATADASTSTFQTQTDTAYTGTPTWTAGASPSGSTTFRQGFTVVGAMCNAWLSLTYGSAGTTVTNLSLTFPTGWPTPLIPTGFTGANLALWIMNARLANTPVVTSSLVMNMFIYRNAGDNGFVIKPTQAFTSSTVRQIFIQVSYPIA